MPQIHDQFYLSLPKVDLHRHLEGSLRLSTMLEVSQQHSLGLPESNQLQSLVQVTDKDPYTFQNFLSKFETLRLFYQSPEIIGRITREAIADAAADHVRYLELRFTPAALSAARGFSLAEVMDLVTGQALLASLEFGITTRLIASVNRHESVQTAEKVVQLALERKGKGIVGLDLAGNEAQFPASPFIGLFREAQQNGLHITLHAGEWGGAEHVAEAINDFNAERIGHGVHVMEDPTIVGLARQRGTAFEVCVTSNYQSGVVRSLSDHPLIRMLEAGLNVTLATDDPGVSRIALGDEYRVVCEQLQLPLPNLRMMILAAAKSAFLSESKKEELLASLRSELDTVIQP